LFKDSGNTVTCTGTLNLNNGSTYRLGRYSGTGGTATVFPAFATINIALGTTVEYAHINGNQTVSITPNYANLSFTSSVASSRVIAAGTLRVRNNLSIGTNTTFLGTTNNPLTQLGGNYTNSGTFTSGTGLFTMNGTSNQSITGTAVFTGGLTISNTGGGGANTVTLNNAITTTGNLSITNGIFNLGSFTANRTAGGGTMTISNGARLVIGGTNGLPGNYTTHAIGATSTVEYNGTTNTVTTPNSSQAYGNLVISASGATTTGTFSIAGILTVTGSLVGSAGTITMSTAASAISNSGTLTFSGLTMGATPTAQSQYNTSYSVAGTLTINVGVTFEPTGGTITMSAAGSAISNSGTTIRAIQ
jgi:fibronectin-binding autotransporter adhesin